MGARHDPAGAVVPQVISGDRSLQALVERVAASGVPLVIDDAGNDPAGSGAMGAMVAIPVARDGTGPAMLLVRDRQVRAWTATEVELLVELAERIRATTERVRATEALKRSEFRFRRLFESMDEGFCLLERLSLPGQPPDFRYVEVNGALLQMLSERWLVGRTLREIFPDFATELVEILEQVARTGESALCERRIPSTGKTLEFKIFRPGSEATHQVAVLSQDITQRKLAEAILTESDNRQRTLIEGIPQFVWRASRTGRWTWSSAQWMDYTGQAASAALVWGWLAMLHPADRHRVRESWEMAAERGRLEVDFRVRRVGTDAYRWFHTRARPVHDEAGAIVEWLGTSTDVHELRNLQLQQQTLAAELQHRTRNLVGVIRTLANRIGSTSVDLADFQARFNTRLDALARAQGLLSKLGEHQRVTFDELLASELDALHLPDGRISLTGPRGIFLKSSSVQTLALALHELLTNAVKYGALSQPRAKLTITWTLDSGAQDMTPWLHIDWKETGVSIAPADRARSHGGHGRELIERALPYQLRARTEYRIHAGGVRCKIAIPISSSVPPLAHAL